MPSFLPSFLPELTRRACGALVFVSLVPAAAMAQSLGLPSFATTDVSAYGERMDDTSSDGATSISAATSSYKGVQDAYAQASLEAGTLRARSGGTANSISSREGLQNPATGRGSCMMMSSS